MESDHSLGNIQMCYNIGIFLCFLLLSGIFWNVSQYREFVFFFGHCWKCFGICAIIWATRRYAHIRTLFFMPLLKLFQNLCQYKKFVSFRSILEFALLSRRYIDVQFGIRRDLLISSLLGAFQNLHQYKECFYLFHHCWKYMGCANIWYCFLLL